VHAGLQQVQPPYFHLGLLLKLLYLLEKFNPQVGAWVAINTNQSPIRKTPRLSTKIPALRSKKKSPKLNMLQST
jgi:hypothetical protein